jgi:hypothetical protein
MILGFTGTRLGMDPDQKEAVYKLLDDLVEHCATVNEDFEVHHGDCIGADEELHYMAVGFGRYVTRIVKHPPKDTKLRAYCQGGVELPPQPYDERNLSIVNAADKIIAAPPTKEPQVRGGTWQTIRFAQTKGNLWRIVFPYGTVVKG